MRGKPPTRYVKPLMRRSLSRSNLHYKHALKRLPAGVASNFRCWGEELTIYAKRGRGARLWDIDDNEYIDYRLGYGPTILGYAHPEVDAAAREGIEVGGIMALSTERELRVAERIVKMVGVAELVRFACSGTEVVMAALRLARAYAGKNHHIMIEGGFHGLSDGVLWQTRIEHMEDADGKPEYGAEGKGIPDVLGDYVHHVPLNDLEALELTMREHGHEIGAMLIEPILGNAGSITASVEYLKGARALCDEHRVVLIFDEVKTGFRVARGGVQELMGVEADLCTFAKAMGNGYPISAFAGREEIMRLIRPGGVAQGGTYAAHPVPLAAAEKTLEILDETDALERIADYGTRMQEGMAQILSRKGIDHVFTGHPSMGGLFFLDEVPTNYRDWADSDYTLYNELAFELNDMGILCEPDSREPWFISAAHDESCMTETLEKFETALAIVLDRQATKA
jgi:glutamate-1-semialdehyde 2,1-aminomutase